MSSVSRSNASELYNTLKTSSPAKRREIGAQVLDGVVNADSGYSRAFQEVVSAVVGEREPEGPIRPRPLLRPGEFTARLSASLADSPARIRGFGGAIARATGVKTFVDLGTGAAALWPLITLHLHPKSEGIGIELNELAAQSAAEVTRLFGVDDRVEIIHGDATTVEIPDADLGVTETYNRIASREPGVQLAYRLGQHARILLPSEIRINATDVPVDNATVWQRASVVNLRDRNDLITGQLTSTMAGRRLVSAHAEYHGDTGPILVDPLADTITQVATLGVVDVQQAGDPIYYSYIAGADLSDHRPDLRSNPR